MIITEDRIEYTDIPEPVNTAADGPVDLTDITMQQRKQKVLEAVRENGLDFLFLYADREHGGNFGYLTGFEPRFEEAALILHSSGKAYLLLGNESVKMGKYSRITAEVVHFPYFSLPNQPMGNKKGIGELLKTAGIQEGMAGGIAGWKMFTSSLEDNQSLFEVPYFLVDAIRKITGESGKIENASYLLISPEEGVRIINNANEIAHFEYGASQASSKILEVMNHVETGKTELELAEHLTAQGQPLSTQAICAAGERFTNAVVAPRNKKVEKGDRISLSMGLRGGLTCRTGYAAEDHNGLPEGEKDYLDKVVKPYYAALATWYSNIRIGMKAGDIYEMIEKALPKEKYGWFLNPGHFTASEEWLSSPFYPDSKVVLKSGRMLQMDIIVSVDGYQGSNAEDGIVLADEKLKSDIQIAYPELWKRMEVRREYMKSVLGIDIHEDLLPVSAINGYLRPFLFTRGKAMKVKNFGTVKQAEK